MLQAIASSPYLPPQHNAEGTRPTQLYYQFASKAGCGNSGQVLDCLRKKDSLTLQQANNDVSISQIYGTWAWAPVTDGSFITTLPSKALSAKNVNGQNMLVGHNANEGPLFARNNITTLAALKTFLKAEFPAFSTADIQNVLNMYPSTDADDNPNALKFATNGRGPATAVNVSQLATGHQQRAYVRISVSPHITRITVLTSETEYLRRGDPHLSRLLAQQRLRVLPRPPLHPQVLQIPIQRALWLSRRRLDRSFRTR